MPLTGESLGCTGGELYAYVSGNPGAAGGRHLVWGLYLNGVPVRWGDDDWETNFQFDWLTWPIRRWPELDGISLDRVVEPELVEATFYLGEHHEASLRALSLRRVDGTRFHVAAAGAFSLEGYEELDGEDIRFRIDCEVRFAGILIDRDHLFPKPSSPAEASAVAAPFIDVADFEAPTFDEERRRFVFEPRANAAG
jgi:hypothetical protein